uniref:Kinetochore protein SPC25 n=1 Tax=Aegilops tauschii subsp. strangulata TaxID=200361 RepID=A0A452XMD1_AEGTS
VPVCCHASAEAFEAKNEEDVTLMKDMEKAICWYQKRLGFQPVVEGEGVKFIFDKVDLQSPEKEFSFSLKFDSDRYTLLQCSPPVEDSEELMKDLNLTNDLVKFVRIIRQRFQAAALNGDLPVSPTVCSDASAIPISSPVIKSVDSRSKNDRDRSNSQSKNRKPALPAKRKASAVSAASPGSVRRSPRFVVTVSSPLFSV